MLAGMEVVLDSAVQGERGSPPGWARGFKGSPTSYLIRLHNVSLDRFLVQVQIAAALM